MTVIKTVLTNTQIVNFTINLNSHNFEMERLNIITLI